MGLQKETLKDIASSYPDACTLSSETGKNGKPLDILTIKSSGKRYATAQGAMVDGGTASTIRSQLVCGPAPKSAKAK